MNRFNKIIYAVVFIFALLLLSSNILLNYFFTSKGRYYMTEINRACADIAEKGRDADLSGYAYINDAIFLSSDADKAEMHAFYESNGTYIIKYIDGVDFLGYVRFTIETITNVNLSSVRLFINAIAAGTGIIVILTLIYLQRRIIQPFNNISEMPVQLAKGHLTKNLKENKNRFFGRFVWGIDMLRETLEAHKLKELMLVKENKMMVLSISHDIKTPLSAIKLYAKALLEDGRLNEISAKINENADKIEAFVNDIIKTSKEDFLNIDVNGGEFYLSDLLGRLVNYYYEKLLSLKTEFVIKPYMDCLIYGDIERSLEAFENIIENAIKYGDGVNITIDIGREEGCCLITISNSGNTLSENEIIHIFDSFWRGSNTKDKQGSGLGLYICRRIFTMMKGDIFAEIENGCMNVTAVLKII